MYEENKPVKQNKEKNLLAEVTMFMAVDHSTSGAIMLFLATTPSRPVVPLRCKAGVQLEGGPFF